MQSFSVQCETCGAKLKVRDEAAIGQIHACPRCESMVLVAAPASLAAGDTPTNPPAEVPAEDTVVPSDFAGEIDSLLETPTPAPAAAPSVPLIDPVQFGGAPTAEPTFAGAEVEPPQEPVQQPTETVEPDLVETPSRLGLIVWGTAGVAVCFVAGVLGAAWWTSGSDDKPQAAASEPATDKSADSQPVVQQQDNPENEADEREQTADLPAPQPEAEQASTPPAEIEPTAPATADHPAEARVASLPSLPELPPPAEEDSQPEAEQPPAARPFDTLPPLDPLAIDSANLDLLLTPDTTIDVAASNTQGMEVEQTEEEAALAEAQRSEVAPRRHIRFEPGSASLGPSFDEQFGEGELQSRLAIQLPSVRWDNVPLHLALRELSVLAGVPITLDAAALRMAAVAASKPVSIDLQNASVLEIAQAVAKQGRLEATTLAGGLLVTKAQLDRVREVRYPVDDLVGIAGEDAAGVAQVIRRLLPDAIWGDSIVVDEGALRITQPAAVHYDVLLFCERLRKFRGLATRSKYPKDLIEVTPRLESLGPKLSRPTTFAFVNWTPTGDVFAKWQEASRLVILPDWRSLADQNLRPQSTMAGSVQNQSWQQALDTCLGALDLGWVPVNGNTLEITTRDRAEQATWIEFYATPDADALGEQIGENCDEASLVTLTLVLDPTGEFVMVRGNRHVHRAAAQ